jgi:gliding motility-associated-like protein
MFFLTGLKSVRKCIFLTGWMLFISNLLMAQLVPAFSPNKTQGCSPLQVSFSNISTGAVSYLWDFGNGNTSDIANPVTTFITPGTYTVTLKARNIAGLESVTTQVITVFSNPVADFSAVKTGGCVNDTIIFTNHSVNGTNAISKWSWDFGDGSGSLAQQPGGHVYTFGDKFNVTLVVEDQFGCRGTAVKNDYIDIADLKVDFSNTVSSACAGPLQVKFTNLTTPANPQYAYSWNFGNSNTSSKQHDSSVYVSKGSYPVSLKVTAPNGCSVTTIKNKLVTIHEPQAAFSVLNPTGCQPLTVNFINQSVSADPGAVIYSWTTSAGHTSALKNPEFVFTDTGTYNVTLKMTIPGVCADSVVKMDYIRVVPAADVTVIASADKFCALPAQVNFSVIPAQSNVLGWIWGDNTISGPGASQAKTYNQFGKFTVGAIIENVAGCRDTVSLISPVIVSPSGFALSFSKKEGCAPFTAFMDAADTGVVAMTNWQWYVNGTGGGNTKTVSYTFNDTGIYVITCVGSNEQGCLFTATDTIKAGALTYPQYSVDKETSCASDATFVFHNQTNQTTPRAESWFWLFGDNFAGLEEEPSHQYQDTGTFSIMLTAIHKGCSTSVAHRQVTVHGPKTSFVAPLLNCQGDSLVFPAVTKGGQSLLWNFGDGNFSSSQNAKHKYAAPGTYQVTLIAHDSITGCSDTTAKTMNIPDIQVPVISFTQSTTAMCPGSTLVLEDHTTGGNIKTWQWVLSNGLHPQGKTTTMTIQDTGYHHLQLLIWDNNGCLFQTRKDSAIRVYQGAVAFDVSQSAGCLPLAITTADHSITTFPVVKRTWKWGTGDHDEGTSETSAYTYSTTPANQAGGYTVQLEVTDSMGCSYKGTQVVKPLKPVAGYNTTVVKGCGYDSVLFLPESTAGGFGPFRFHWLAGKDTLSKDESPYLRFTMADTSFAVNLIVSDSFGCSNSFSSIISTDARTPVASFGAVPQRILDCPGPPVFFTDSTTRGASGIKSWEWSFGDNTKSVLQGPSKTYLEPGNYDVTLKITDSLNCQSAITKSGYVRIAGPVASYKIISTDGCMPLATSFEAVSPNTKKFEWDMGDGLVDTNAVYHHVYSRSGKYTPSLSITDSAGCRRVLPITDTIVVHKLPQPGLSHNKKRICAGTDVQFMNSTTHDLPIVKYTWKFGDDDSLVHTVPGPVVHTYANTGVFHVVLEATDSLGCSDTAMISDAITVTDDTIAPAIPQVLRSTVIDNQSVLLQFRQNNESDFVKYKVYYNYNASGIAGAVDSSFAISDTVFTQQGINTLNNRYFYSVSATDVCLNESERSMLHGTMELTASPAGNSITLQWSAYKGWNVADYEIFRSNDGSNKFEPVAKVKGDVTLFTDSTVLCHRTYFYKIRAVESAGNGQESWSDSSGAAPNFISTVPGTKNVRATVTDRGAVLLEWRKQFHTLSFVPVLYRSVNDEEAVFYKELNTQDTFFIDNEADVHRNSYTYITYLKDNCGGLSRPSNPAKTILLSSDLERATERNYNPLLTWTSYIGWESGVDKYVVEFKYDSLARFIPKANTEKLSFFDRDAHEKQRKYCYRITAYQKGEQDVYSQSNAVCASIDPVIYAPTAFTPNGDGINETFKVGGVFLEQFNIKIWNRYGELVYESNDMLEGWDGTYMGKTVQADTYTYLAEGRGRTGQLVQIKGSVTVLK